MDNRDLQLLKRLRDESSAEAAEINAARRLLNAEIQREISGGRQRTRVSARLPQLVASAGIAVVALVVGVVIVAQLARPAPVTAELREIAAVAEASTPLTEQPGAGVYVESTRSNLVQVAAADVPGASGEVFSFILPELREVWVAPDGSRLLRVTVGEPRFLANGDAELFAAAELGAVFGVGEVEVVELAAPEVDIDLSALPLDIADLRIALLAEAGEGEEPVADAVRLFEVSGAVLRETTASGPLRAAVLEVLAAEGDSIEVLRNDDVLEIAVTYLRGGSEILHSLTFDKASSALVAERVTFVSADGSAGVPAGTAIVDATFSIPRIEPLP